LHLKQNMYFLINKSFSSFRSVYVLVIFCASGALVYRVLELLSRKTLMLIHMAIMAVVLILSIFGKNHKK